MSRMSKRNIRILSVFIFILYVALLIYICFFSERYGRTEGFDEMHYNLEPFREIKRYMYNIDAVGIWGMLKNVFGNVIAFIPYGFIYPILRKRHKNVLWAIGMTFLLSLGIEVIQLLTRTGAFDVDDLILNTSGGLIGYIIFQICNAIRRRRLG